MKRNNTRYPQRAGIDTIQNADEKKKAGQTARHTAKRPGINTIQGADERKKRELGRIAHEDERYARMCKKWLHTLDDAHRRDGERHTNRHARIAKKSRKTYEYEMHKSREDGA